MKTYLSRRRVAFGAALALIAGIATAWLVGWLRTDRAPVTIVLGATLGDADAAVLEGVLAPFRERHPYVTVTVRPLARGGASAVLAARAAHVVLADRAELDARARAFEPLFLAEQMVLAYDRTVAPGPPSSWNEIIRTASARKARGESFGIGLPEDAYAILPLLAPALRARDLESAQKVYALLHRVRFGLGLAPEGCSMACVAHELAAGRIAYGLVGEWRLPELRHALGDRLGVAPVPPIVGDATPADALAAVYGLALSDPMSEREARAARSLVAFLRDEAHAPLARALDKTEVGPDARPRGGRDAQAFAVDDAGRAKLRAALPTLQGIWTEFTSGRVAPSAAAQVTLSIGDARLVE